MNFLIYEYFHKLKWAPQNYFWIVSGDLSECDAR